MRFLLPSFSLPVIFLAVIFAVFSPGMVEAEVQARHCPFSCKSEGIPKHLCRDWRRGNTCYVEDLRRHGHYRRPYPGVGGRPQILRPSPPSGDARACHYLRRRDIANPRIEIYEVRPSGNYFKNKVRVYGTVEGSCLQEAGAYERNRLVSGFNVPSRPEFGRYDFSAQVDLDQDPSIRVYNVFGNRSIRVLDNLHRHQEPNRSPNYWYR